MAVDAADMKRVRKILLNNMREYKWRLEVFEKDGVENLQPEIERVDRAIREIESVDKRVDKMKRSQMPDEGAWYPDGEKPIPEWRR